MLRVGLWPARLRRLLLDGLGLGGLGRVAGLLARLLIGRLLAAVLRVSGVLTALLGAAVLGPALLG